MEKTKFELKSIVFTFDDVKNECQYKVVCPQRKRGSHEFHVFDAGNKKKLGAHKPQGGHANKTSALYALQYIIDKTYSNE